MAQVAGLTPGHPAFGIYQQIPGGYKSQFAQAVLSGQSPEQALQALWGGADPFGVIKSLGGTTGPSGVTLGGAGPGAAGGGVGGLAGQVQQQQQVASEAANAANEARYQELRGGFEQQRGQLESTFGQQRAALEGQGQAAAQDIERAFTRERSRGMQGLMSAGLSGTTVAPTMGLSYTRQAAQEQQRLREWLGLQQTNLLGQQASQRANLAAQQFAFQERRTDAFPQQQPYLALQQQAGATLGAGQALPSLPRRSLTGQYDTAINPQTGQTERILPQSTYPGVSFTAAPRQQEPTQASFYAAEGERMRQRRLQRQQPGLVSQQIGGGIFRQ